MSEFKSFETERLLLQPTSEEDAPFLYELFNTPKWLKYIGDRNINSIEDAKKYISNKITPQFIELSYSNYTVIRKSDRVKMGSCGLYNREGVEGIDIGFAFLPEYEKKGYAFESANKIKEVAMHYFNLDRISAITIKENGASQLLLEKLGFRYVQMVNLPDDDEELLLYRLDA